MNTLEYARLFEHLTPADIDGFDQVFAADARFCDPFNDVQGVESIQRVFRHMFEHCEEPRFEILETVSGEAVAYFHWRFHFRRRAENYTVDGASRVAFDRNAKVTSHVDFWDPTCLYERIPLLGRILRGLRRRLRVA